MVNKLIRLVALLGCAIAALGAWPNSGKKFGGGGGGGGAALEAPGPNSILFSAPYYSCSTNRYVATAGGGGSDSNDGQSATVGGGHGPWLTLAHANAAVPSAGWCINVQNGSYATGVSVTHGGNLASSTGYVVYRCATLNGCTITDTGSGTNNAAIAVNASYVMVDGFVFN